MSTALAARRRARLTTRSRPRRNAVRSAPLEVLLRSAVGSEADVLHALIATHREEGHLLPREVDELRTHATRFVVAVQHGHIVGCAELAPLSDRVAEVRSLVVDRRTRSLGIGRRLVAELQRRATLDGYATLCAFTHEAGFFVRLGFSIVPHTSVPEKIAHDCRGCVHFGRCGQHALVMPLSYSGRAVSPPMTMHEELRG